MDRNIIDKIMCLSNGALVYEDTVLEFVDADEKSVVSMRPVNSGISENGVSIGCDIEGYAAEVHLSKLESGFLEYHTSLNVKHAGNKIRKITTYFHVLDCVDTTYALTHAFLDSGIGKTEELAETVNNDFFCALFGKDGRGLTFLSHIPAKFNSVIRFEKCSGHIKVAFETVVPYSYTGSLASEKVMIACSMPYHEAIEKHAALFRIKKEWASPIGWGSWDYYFTSVNEDDIKENVDFIVKDKILSDKIRYIAIDDGWQQREGDWREGVRFSGGLKKTVDYIKENGFEAGIWIAPTRLHWLSGTVMRRNDFLIKNNYGDPIRDEEYYVLDPTHPDGERYLRETFTYLRNIGFTFYKIDFISNMLCADNFYDKSSGHYDALSKLMCIVRECVGEESHIMGCSLPYGHGGEGIDSRRAGLDIHNTRGHIIKCTEIYFPQYASHRTLYQHDVDYLIVRGRDTSVEKETNVLNPLKGEYAAVNSSAFRWREGKDFSYRDAKTWCTTVLMTGSSIFLGDRLSKLNEDGLDLIRKTLRYADFNSSVPVGAGGVLPEIWYKEKTGSIYILNYSDRRKTYELDLSGLKGMPLLARFTDIFSEEKHISENGRLLLSLKAHDAVALYLEGDIASGDEGTRSTKKF